ncbi:MAG TPA: hypothetical protein VD789_05170 [Thermomicrobiales bacterium]|nr:hypothetical protein [Thermomicrobiales bacterium]
MVTLQVRRKQEPKGRFRDLEKRFDLKDLEKKLDRIDLKDLERYLDFDKELAKRYRDLVGRQRAERKKASTGRFIAGLVIGLIVGTVLAMVVGRKNSGSNVIGQVTHQADALRDNATDRYQQMRGDQASQTGAAAEPFGSEAAIEREVNGEDDIVETARDTIDSASEDVQSSVEEIQSEGNSTLEDAERRTGQL